METFHVIWFAFLSGLTALNAAIYAETRKPRSLAAAVICTFGALLELTAWAVLQR